jgi:hypothetical protein
MQFLKKTSKTTLLLFDDLGLLFWKKTTTGFYEIHGIKAR